MSITSIPSLIPLFSRTLSAPFGDQFRSVLIADAGSTDIDDLLVGAQQEPHWVFDSNQAIGVITEVLANRDTDTLHIVAHGRARGIRFGGGWLDAGALFDAKELLAQWQVKNIALWSCGLAQDDPFVRMLALFTGARVFSSASALGMVDGLPNWRLDGDDGGFDTPAPPFSAAAIASWPHTLASLSFVNAYAVNTATTAASKEANSVDISFVSRNVARIDDMSGGQNFSGNDVVARLVVDGVEYFGWISRPIKSGGDIKGYYFWSDPSFTSLAAATADSNADGDGNSADNFGFVLVVDQAWFDQQAGTTIKNVGTSSDRVDNGMNALLAVNSAPALVNDSGAFTEDAGAQTGNVLLNDADANLDALTVTGFKIGNVAGTLGAAFNIANVGSFTLLANGAYTFTPVSNHAGTVPLVTYTAADGRGGSSSAYLSINVAQVNDAPSGTSGTISSRENAVYTFGAADFGFSDDLDNPANTLLSVKIATLPDPAKGMLTLNGIAVTSGAFVAVADITRLKFLPVANGTGTGFANFTFQVRDNGGGATDIDLSANTISFDIVDVNSAPLAVNDAASTTEAGGAGNGVTFAAPAGKLLANDTDIDAADTRSVASASGAGTGTTAVATNTVITGSHGVLTLSSDGSYIYTVNNASGAVQAMRTAASTLTDTFTYTMKDGDGLTSTALLTVTIGGSNDSIDAVNDANFAVSSTTAQFRLNPGGNVLRNDGDVDSGDAMSVTRASKGAALSGSPTTIGAGSSASGVEHSTYTTFVVDSAGISPGDIVVVTAGNSSSGYFPVSTTVLSFSAGSKTVTVSDAGYIGAGSALTIGSGLFSVASVGAAHTTKVAIFVATGDGSITNGVGVTGSGIGPGTTVTAVNSAAVSGGTMYQVTLSQALTGALGTNLVFGSAGTTIAGDYGNLLLQNDGSYTYAVTGTTTTGTETFTYEVRDTSGALSTAKLTIGITNATAAAPVLVADSKTISENGSVVSGNLLSNDSGASGLIDAQGSGATFLAASAAGTVVAGRYGTLTVHNAGGQAEGAYAYAVAAGNASVDALNGSQTLTDVFQYRAAGAGGTFAISSLTITINGANDAPLAVNDTATAREAGGADNAAAGLNPAGNVKGNDSDPDNGDSIAVSMAGTSSAAATVAGGSSAANGLTIVGAYGSLKLGADGSFTYAVDNSNAAVQALGLASGGLADTFTYQLRDAAGLTSTATLTLDVLGANDAPVNALNAGATIAQGVAGALAGISVADVDDASITVSLAVVSGVLAIGTLGAAAISAGVNGSARLTLSGSPADINSALATLSYQGGPDFSGTDTLTVTSRDAGALQDIDILDITVSPDNRALTVSSLSVNEASPFAVFTVTGAVGQKVTLALPDIAGAARAAAGADYQSVLDYFDGAAWLPYDGNPVAIPAGGDLFVRIGVLQDTADEGAEAFNLIALNKAGTSVSGTATIYDNGLGIIYDGSIVGGTPATATTGLDDDRAVSVTNISVNENSPYAVFTLTGSASQVVTLAIGNGNASNADHGSAIEYFDGAGWRAYGSSVTLPAGGTLFLRVSITTDSVYEGPESFGIVASNLSGRSYVGTATINDDGRGLVFPGTITAGAIDSAAIGLDNDLAVALVAFGPVNEASAYAMYTVTATAGEVLGLALAGSGSAPATAAGFTLDFSYDGIAWSSYGDATQPIVPAGGLVYVRAAIASEQDTSVEGAETFALTASISSGLGKSASATSTIVDDGSGSRYDGSVSGGLPVADTTGLDQDGDLTPPTIAITASTATLGMGQSATITFTLSEAATDFAVGDVAVSGGSLASFSGSGAIYTATFTPAASSTANGVVSVASGKFADAAGNANADGADSNNTLTMAVNTVAADTTAPTIAISSDASALAVGQSATITFTLSEAASDFVAADVAVSGGILSNFSGSGSSYSATFTPAASSTVNGVVSVASGRFADAAGNANADGADSNNTLTMAVNTVAADTTAPTIAISSNASALVVGQSATITFTLSEAASDFVAADVAVSGGSLSNFSGSGASYSATFTPAASSTANGVVSVASGRFADAAGNANADGADSNNTLTMTVNTVAADTTAPTIAISSNASALAVGQSATITFTLSEAASDFDASDIAVSGGSLSNFSGSGSGSSYSATFTPAASSTANGVVSVASGRFADAAGNANADGADSNNTVTMTVNTVVTDTTAPRIAITSNASVLIAGQTALIAFALSEPSTSFDLADIDVSGGALSEFSGSGASYSAVFTPTAGAVATASLSVGDARFADASGNLNADGADADNSVMLAIRTLRPTIAIASDKTALALGDSASVSFTLSQASSDFSGADIVASGGILSGFAGSGMHYSATFTPFADSNANAVISVAGGTFVDSFGNANADGADADNRVAMAVDTRPPTVSVSIDRNTIGAGESALVTFTLSEASADFSNADVTAAGGTLSALSGGGAVYTATFTPAPAFVGTASLHVASGRLRDAAGNFNGDGADADNRVSVVINTVEPAPAPTVVLLDDLDNDGFFSRAELQGDADVAIYLPAGTRAGDVLTVSDGSATRRLVVGAEDLAGGIVNTSFAAPGVNAAITVTASVAPPGGLQGGAGADSARRGSGVDFTFTDISTDTGIVGDFITTDNTLVLGGTAESGELVTITVDGVAVGTAVAVDNRWTFDYSATPLPRGDHHVTASIGALAGETVSVIVQLFSADLDPSSDDGESNLDHITGNTTPNFVLHAQGIMQAGDTARLLDPNGTVIGHSLVTQGNLGAGSVDVPTRPLNDGVYTFLAQIIAPDGQVRVSQPVSVTIITDRDGVMPLTELAANGGDFNHDGVFDWQQNNVAQLPLTSLEAFAMNENAPAQSFGAIMAGNLATPGGAVALTANAQLLGVALVATPASLPSNTTAATPMMQFSVTGANQQALTDLDPGRAGLQTRVIIDLPAGVTANTFLKWDPVAMRWFNFVDDQRLDTLDDGATLIDANSDGKIDRVVVTLTDGGRGDADGQVNGMIVDPGMLAQVAATPVHSILLANGDRFYTTSAAEALQYAKGVANVYEGVRFDSLSDTPAARQMEARWQPFTEDWFFGASPTADPYLCYEATGGAGFRAAGAGAGIGVDFHLFTNADGMTQLLTPGEANTLGLAAKGYTSMGAQFNTTTSSAYSFDAEGYLIANRDSADVQTFVRSLASQYQHSSDAGFIEAVETHYLTQVTLIGVPHGTAASVGDLNAVFGTTFL